jgi:hypothetical protein
MGERFSDVPQPQRLAHEVQVNYEEFLPKPALTGYHRQITGFPQ